MHRTDKHGRIVDDHLADQAKGMRPGASSRADEWRDPDAPVDDESLSAPRTAGPPGGMTAEDVEGRSRLARFLQPSGFPAGAAALRAMAESMNAPDDVREELARLPGGDREYVNVTEVWRALGHGAEDLRGEDPRGPASAD